VSEIQAHERWRDELAAYLLGSLSSNDAQAMERHLDGCKVCREELRWLGPALEVLPESVEPLEPSPRLRERIMAEVQADRAPAEAGERAAPRTRRARFRTWALRPAIGLAATAVVAGGVAGYVVHGEGGGQSIPPEPSTTLMLSHRMLELTNLSPPPADRTYEAWTKVGSRVDPAGTFRPQPDGSARVLLPPAVDRASEVMVTLEPHGGSLQPTGKPLLRVPLH
jgi:anti-sigma-K factor RskA